MSNYVVSLIRTYVPVVVGLILGAVGLSDLDVDTAAITGAIVAVYYAVVRALEIRFPWIGVLLGQRSAPDYTK